jgi:NCS1 family nucleobase:cation symporter-1
VLAESGRLQKQLGNFWTIFPGALTASVGYWATLSLNIPDFTRYARSQKSQMLGQALGLPLTMTAFAFIGVAVTSATLLIYGTAIPNPVDLMAKFDSVTVLVIATIVIFAAQISTNMAANVVSPSNDFSNLNPKLISYVTGGIITAIIGIIMMPWKLMGSMGAYIFTWLIGYSGLMGAIGGVMICDYWILRKQRLNLRELF